MTCGHIFKRQHIMNYMGSSLKGCPVIGCPGAVSNDLVFEDAELRHDIKNVQEVWFGYRSNRLQFCNARQTSAVFCFSGRLSFTFGLNKAFSG
uniref:Uncharacterized protein n=1 Tax=Oryza glumipatula TaxID=40148 RepID=A0A0D9YAV2_9ORYZ